MNCGCVQGYVSPQTDISDEVLCLQVGMSMGSDEIRCPLTSTPPFKGVMSQHCNRSEWDGVKFTAYTSDCSRVTLVEFCH